jgi:hypothetical protein
MAVEVNASNVGQIQKDLERAVIEAIKSAGLGSYELESIVLKPKADLSIMGLAPGCHLECTVGGFPPKVSCSVKCG